MGTWALHIHSPANPLSVSFCFRLMRLRCEKFVQFFAEMKLFSIVVLIFVVECVCSYHSRVKFGEDHPCAPKSGDGFDEKPCCEYVCHYRNVYFKTIGDEVERKKYCPGIESGLTFYECKDGNKEVCGRSKKKK